MMSNKFEELTKLIPDINTDRINELIDAVYALDEKNPEIGFHDYRIVLEANGIEWDFDSMQSADVSRFDAKVVMALLLGAIRADHFCDGALNSFVKNGTILRWLERLKVIDEAE